MDKMKIYCRPIYLSLFLVFVLSSAVVSALAGYTLQYNLTFEGVGIGNFSRGGEDANHVWSIASTGCQRGTNCLVRSSNGDALLGGAFLTANTTWNFTYTNVVAKGWFQDAQINDGGSAGFAFDMNATDTYEAAGWFSSNEGGGLAYAIFNTTVIGGSSVGGINQNVSNGINYDGVWVWCQVNVTASSAVGVTCWNTSSEGQFIHHNVRITLARSNKGAFGFHASRAVKFDDIELYTPAALITNVTEINFTSDAPPASTCSFPTLCANTTDTTPTFTLATIDNVHCRMSTTDQNFSLMTNNCTPAGTYATNHSCTLNNALSWGNSTLHFACQTSDGVTTDVAPAPNSKKALLYVDVAPTVTLNAPTNNSVINDVTSIVFNYTVVEDGPDTVPCSLYVNGTLIGTNTTNNNTITRRLATGLNYGRSNWSINCTDSYGRTSNSGAFYLNISDTIAPSVTLQTPKNNSVLAGLYNFFFIATDASSSLTCRFYINDTLIATNSTTLNNTNTSFSTTINSTHGNWNVNCTDGGGNVGYSGKFLFSYLSVINLYFDSVLGSRKYEIGRTAEINLSTNYTGTLCVDIGTEVNFSCQSSEGAGFIVNYTIVNQTMNRVNDTLSNTTINSTGGRFALILDNRTDVNNASFGLFGSAAGGNYPENITIDDTGDGVVDYNLPCQLREGIVYCYLFRYDGAWVPRKNITFATAGSDTVYLNLSALRLRSVFQKVINSTFANFSLQLIGQNKNGGQTYSFLNSFNASGAFNMSQSLNVSSGNKWSDMQVNEMDKVTFTNYNRCVDESTDGELRFHCTGASASGQVVTASNLLDIKKPSNITIRYMNDRLGAGPVTTSFSVSDGTTAVSLFTSPDDDGNYHNLTITKDAVTPSAYAVYYDGALQNTIGVSALDSAKNWSLVFVASAPNSNSELIMRVDDIVLSSLLFDRTGATFRTFGEVNSKQLTNYTTNVNSVYLDAVDQIRYSGNESITYYVSANNGSTWTQATKGQDTVVSTAGRQVRWRAIFNLTGSALNSSPILHSVDVRVVGGIPENITLDLGADGVADYTFTGFMNGTNSTLNVSLSSSRAAEYMNNSCRTGQTCAVPLKITSGTSGAVQVDTFNFTYDLGGVPVNLSSLESNTYANILLSFTGGNITVRNADLKYYGSNNLTVLAHTPPYSVNSSTNITVRYSKFNVSFPRNVFSWNVFSPSTNSTRVAPFGQNRTVGIWKIDSLAYDDPMDIYLIANHSIHSCLTIWSTRINQSNASTVWRLNTSRTDNATAQVIKNLNLTQSLYIWQWVNFTACPRFNVSRPVQVFDSQCQNCVIKWT